ncbi:MAG: hypothetical protein OJF49_001407 [Ktedonobacterales bacterium]|nr:MAG: hypothetical protein OJF49_001407 [Ktedonobacterales bacterium]
MIRETPMLIPYGTRVFSSRVVLFAVSSDNIRKATYNDEYA